MDRRVGRVIALEIYKYVTNEVNQICRLALPLGSTRHLRQFSARIDKARLLAKADPQFRLIAIFRRSAIEC